MPHWFSPTPLSRFEEALGPARASLSPTACQVACVCRVGPSLFLGLLTRVAGTRF